MRSRVVIGSLAALAVLAAILWIPWATQKRAIIASTPVPPANVAPTPSVVPAGATACMQNVTFYSRTQTGEIALTVKGAGPPLSVVASAKGYRATTSIPGGYPSRQVRFQLAPAKQSVIGQICFHNDGKSEVSFDSSHELVTQGRPSLLINGALQPVDSQLVFYDEHRASYLSRVGEIFGHAANLTPPFMAKGVLMLLGLLALVGMPVAMAAALRRAVREDDERAA